MRCFVVFFFSLFVSFLAAAENDSCSFISSDSDCPLKGRVKIVSEYEMCDLVVRFVSYDQRYDFVVESKYSVPSYDECPCGVVQFVGKYERCDIRIRKASSTERCDLIVYVKE